MQKRAVVSKRGVDGNLIGRCSLQPAKENQCLYIRKIRACKEHKLTGLPQGFKLKKEGADK